MQSYHPQARYAPSSTLPPSHLSHPMPSHPQYLPLPQGSHHPIPMPSQRSDRAMYRSNIQPSTAPLNKPGGFGLGGLAAMGRTIREEVQPQQNWQTFGVFPTQSKPGLSFRTNKAEKPRMASSVIFFGQNGQGTEHSSMVNTPIGIDPQGGLTGLSFLSSRAREVV
jgi:hypothetical protein